MATKKAAAKKPAATKAAAKKVAAGSQAIATAQDITLAPDAITIGKASFAPVEVVEAAARWLEEAGKQGWSLRDARNAEVDKPRIER